MAVEWDVSEDGGADFDVAEQGGAEWGSGEYVQVRVQEVRDYEQLENLPSIEGVTLIGNRTQQELGVKKIGNAAILDLF